MEDDDSGAGLGSAGATEGSWDGLSPSGASAGAGAEALTTGGSRSGAGGVVDAAGAAGSVNLPSLGGTGGGAADSVTGGERSTGGSDATGTGGATAWAGASGAAGSLSATTLPAHCNNGILEPLLGELLLDCGGECAPDCSCAGQVAPTLGTDCNTGLPGNCSAGTVICESTGLRCAASYGTPEICDGLDNDCNGVADFPYELVDADGDLWPACADSDDADPDNWRSHATCVDQDGDGLYWGCDAYTLRPGPDCNDHDPTPGSCAKNVILFIGDGMGFNHVRAGRCYKNGNTASLVLETLPSYGEMTTYSASSSVTDSAASGTAMATGRKVNNGVLAMAIPGNGADLPTALELRKARGQATGLVTIHDSIVGATPAGFGAHTESRGNVDDIAGGLSAGSHPNLLFGDNDAALVPSTFADAGYTVVETEQALINLDPTSTQFLFGMFPSDVPTLALRTSKALGMLAQDPDGFFLMVEQADTDKQSHANNLEGVVDAVVALDAAVEVALAWAANRTDTLIIVTADHETGGIICSLGDLVLTSPEVFPECSFTTGVHTGVNVPIFATGVGAESVTGILDNTDVFALIAGVGP